MINTAGLIQLSTTHHDASVLLPSTREEALIAASQMTTRDNALIEVDYERQIVGIFDTMAIQLTKDVEDFFGDGTFKSCSKQFHQIYNVITYANGSYVPLAFFLLPDKKEKTYEAMFQHFRRVFERMNGGNLENKTIYLDFEKAAHEFVKHVLPTFALRGCLFHLKQSWRRKIQELGHSRTVNPQWEGSSSRLLDCLSSTFWRCATALRLTSFARLLRVMQFQDTFSISQECTSPAHHRFLLTYG